MKKLTKAQIMKLNGHKVYLDKYFYELTAYELKHNGTVVSTGLSAECYDEEYSFIPELSSHIEADKEFEIAGNLWAQFI